MLAARRSLRPLRPLASVLALGVIAVGVAGVPGSGAAFSARTTNPGNTLRAASDWVAPTVAVVDPGAVLSGTVALRATASDSGSGVRDVALQQAPNAGGEAAYATVCTAVASPWTCSWDTTKVADGLYKVRATATDVAGNAATSDVVSQRLVDNTAPVVALSDPGSGLQPGPVTLTATAQDATSGVARVVLQRAASAAGPWTDVCTRTAAPYSCTWNATAGDHLLRAVAYDVAGNTATTTPIARTVRDTVRPTGTTVATRNAGGGTAGTMGTGDAIVLRWSEPMALGTLLTGLNADTPTALAVRVTNPALGLGGEDTVSFVASGSGPTPALGTIGLGSSSWLGFLSSSVTYSATAVGRTVDGVTEVTVTLGGRTAGSATPTNASPVVLTWTPAAAGTDLAGNATTTTTVAQPAAGVAF